MRRLKTYQKEIKLVRLEKDEEGFHEKEAVKKILKLWKNLKDLRKKQGYQGTDMRIIIHRVYVIK